jgi:hypothetical protein
MNESLIPQLSKNTDDWFTPKYLIEEFEKEFGKFDFDPCPLNSKENCLIDMEWKGNVFCNPPYSNVAEFLNKGILELKKGNAKQLVFLIIPRTSSKYWRDYVMKYANKIYFISYRLKFGDSKTAAPFPSCIVIFRDLMIKDYVPCYSWNKKEILGGGNDTRRTTC